MLDGLSEYDFALLAIPLVLFGSAAVAVVSSVGMAAALAGGSVLGTGVLYHVLVRRPPSRDHFR